MALGTGVPRNMPFTAGGAAGAKAKNASWRGTKPLTLQKSAFQSLLLLWQDNFATKEYPETKLQTSSYGAVIIYFIYGMHCLDRTTALIVARGNSGLYFTGMLDMKL